MTTLEKAIKNDNLITWPSIDDLNFRTLINTTEEHLKGHLDQEKQNLQSTKADLLEDAFPSKEKEKTHDCLSFIILVPSKYKDGLAYSDQTGRFPFASSRGHEYFYVMYCYDANAILVKPIKNRKSRTLVEAWDTTHKRLTKNGHKVTMYILDNEFSGDLKFAMEEEKISYQLVPPGQHRRNAAERAIRTF